MPHDIKLKKTRNKNKLTIDFNCQLDSGDSIDVRVNYHGKSDLFTSDLAETERVYAEEIGSSDITVSDASDIDVLNLFDKLLSAGQKNNSRVKSLIG